MTTMEQIPIAAVMGIALPDSLNSSRRLSRDEMNLAEFPLTVLSTRASTPNGTNQIKTLEFSDQIRGKNGEIVNREWIITGADKFGLPTSSDDEVLLGLLKLTVDAGFCERKVYFSRYELLKILRWSTEGRSYQRLQRALDRLSGVRIRATNAFYDNETKSHSTKNFGLVDAYEINDGRGLDAKPSFFAWSDALFKSFKVGFIKKFDLDFYLDLRSAVSRRLFRYLDKHFWYKSRIQIGLFTLAHEKVGVSRNYVYASSLRQQLDPAFEELIERGVLSKVEYAGKGRDTEVVIYASHAKPRVTMSRTNAQPPMVQSDLRGEVGSVTSALYDGVFQLLIDRGLKENQVERLLAGKTGETIGRIQEIVAYFDMLCTSGSRLVSKSPIGFLYRAVENTASFMLPGEQAKGAQQTSLGFVNKSREQKEQVEQERVVRTSSLEGRYLVERRREIQKLRETLEPALLKRMEKEVEEALFKLKGLISGARFQEAIEHGVDEKIAKLFALPEFSEWEKSQGKIVTSQHHE